MNNHSSCLGQRRYPDVAPSGILPPQEDHHSMANKSDRQRAIREVIEARPVGSQEELRRLLLSQGWDVTQSTLSRDLREMRLARIPTADGVRYSFTSATLPEERPRLEELLPQFFHQVDGVGELAVLRTASGGAQPVSEAIDLESSADILGTIAGENTILVICRSASAREKFQRRVRVLAKADD
jgi:transcriptional regulator of arginine metabolism